MKNVAISKLLLQTPNCRIAPSYFLGFTLDIVRSL